MVTAKQLEEALRGSVAEAKNISTIGVPLNLLKGLRSKLKFATNFLLPLINNNDNFNKRKDPYNFDVVTNWLDGVITSNKKLGKDAEVKIEKKEIKRLLQHSEVIIEKMCKYYNKENAERCITSLSGITDEIIGIFYYEKHPK